MFLNSIYSQDYKPLEWDIVRVGLLFPTDKSTISSGLGLSTEVRYNVTNEISIGGRFALDFFGAGNNPGTETDISLRSSLALAGDYYFSTTSNNRPFAGIGIGHYNGLTIKTTTNGVQSETKTGDYIGLIPRVGYEFGFARISAEYNHAFDGNATSYFGIHLGFTIGGRRK